LLAKSLREEPLQVFPTLVGVVRSATPPISSLPIGLPHASGGGPAEKARDEDCRDSSSPR